MARFDPRYGTNAGYATGDALLQLAQLLRQGTVDYQRQQTIDEESGRRDQDYLLRLQQMLGQDEDRAEGKKGREFDQNLALANFLRVSKPKEAEPFTLGEGQTRFDPSGQAMANVPKSPPLPKEPEPFTLGEGQTRFGPDGSPLANVPKSAPLPKEPEPFTLGEGQTRFKPDGSPLANVPKVAEVKPPKPFYEGKSPTELDIIIADPSTPPEQRDIARAALKSINAEALARARNTGAVAAENATARALGPQPITAEERLRVAEGERSVQLAQRSLATLEQNPDWAGGPLGLQGRGRQWQSSLGVAPKGFAEFESDVAEIYGTYARRIAGAALTPTEKQTYLQYLPNLKTDSGPQFAAKLKAFPERVRVIDAALDRARLGTAAPTQRTPDFRYNPATGQLEPVK